MSNPPPSDLFSFTFSEGPFISFTFGDQTLKTIFGVILLSLFFPKFRYSGIFVFLTFSTVIYFL